MSRITAISASRLSAHTSRTLQNTISEKGSRPYTEHERRRRQGEKLRSSRMDAQRAVFDTQCDSATQSRPSHPLEMGLLRCALTSTLARLALHKSALPQSPYDHFSSSTLCLFSPLCATMLGPWWKHSQRPHAPESAVPRTAWGALLPPVTTTKYQSSKSTLTLQVLLFFGKSSQLW